MYIAIAFSNYTYLLVLLLEIKITIGMSLSWSQAIQSAHKPSNLKMYFVDSLFGKKVECFFSIIPQNIIDFLNMARAFLFTFFFLIRHEYIHTIRLFFFEKSNSFAFTLYSQSDTLTTCERAANSFYFLLSHALLHIEVIQWAQSNNCCAAMPSL